MNEARIERLLRGAIGKVGLALKGRTVLTEAGSGYFSLTPALAALAGADQVYALTGDSRYGTADALASETMRRAGQLGVSGRIQVLRSRRDPRLRRADIVTNLGFVRPIDAALLEQLRPEVVVPLMWETWEYRREDLDLELCHARGIPVLGTDEHHAALDTFGYIGQIAIKLLHELDVEVFDSRIAVLGSGEFASRGKATLEGAGAHCEVIGLETLAAHDAVLASADALVILEHHNRTGRADIRRLKELNPGLVIAHICGAVAQNDLEACGLRFRPERIAPAGSMSATTAYVGPKPLIDLHAAGLAVGEAMADAVAGGLRGIAAEKRALERCEFAQGFHGRH